MHFKHLSDVHPGWHTQRIEHNIARSSISHVRHIFNRHNLGNHAFVAMPTRHLVSRLKPTLDSQINLDHFQHACWQFIALCQFFTLFFKRQIEAVTCLLHCIFNAFELGSHIVIGWTNIKPMELFHINQICLVNLAALGKFFRPAISCFTN